MKQNLETTIEHAQKITLGQVENGTLATAVTCAETLQIVRHGRVESYVVPKHLIDELLLKMAVLECDNKRLLGDRVAESIEVPKSHFFNYDFKIDMDAVTSCDRSYVSASTQEISRRIRKLKAEPSALWDKSVLDRPVFVSADYIREFHEMFLCGIKPTKTPTNTNN